MKKPNRLCTIAVLLVSSALAANDKLSIEATAPQGEIKAGSQVVVHLKISNNSNSVVTYVDRQRDCDYKVDVLTSLGTPARPTPSNKDLKCNGPSSGRKIVVTLNPGETQEDDIELTHLFNMEQPGSYSATISRKYPGVGNVTSNTVSVNIVP
jgi:hypothetical protein